MLAEAIREVEQWTVPVGTRRARVAHPRGDRIVAAFPDRRPPMKDPTESAGCSTGGTTGVMLTAPDLDVNPCSTRISLMDR